MAVVVLQHTPGADPPVIGAAVEAVGLDLRAYRAWAGHLPDDLTGVDGLVVTGGPKAICSEDDATRHAELGLLRGALAAEVPVLGIREGAQLLAEAAGGAARSEPDAQFDWGPLELTPAAGSDPLFGGTPAQPRVPHQHGDSVELPREAVVLASDDRHPVQAFRIGGSAWGLQFPLEADAAALNEEARSSLAALEPWRDLVLGRFAALVAARAEHTATRAFFTRRAGAWEDRFAYQTPAYAAAVARMELGCGQTALDLGCGTGRAMPALRAQVGDEGKVFGVDVTHAMLTAAARIGRSDCGQLLLADCTRLPFPSASVHGIFAAGLLDHLPHPRTALREWARVSAADGTLLLFHPAGRAERAARHGRPLSPDDPLAEPNLRPELDATGWHLTVYDDAEQHFLARATLAR
ncbi:methyltransferase domain-containing protein [Streptomyces sp. Isolate_45]|uniref:methyltransferase domain-containing protein n=1 Tax=Streptomyces sp. Isolate_45 TaxID=2950111 RepID=UPI002481CF9D|nr:methyltransferase domain-containing protein [Streptomyces sp. Isolate_45]MDA5280878.1 methyltransferase domain-containing protein [Streptomyces sp. Isolate_45]